MDISELRVIYSPQYEGINNLIKRWFRLHMMVCRAWAQERTLLNSHRLVLNNESADYHNSWLLILCSKNVLGL